MRERPILFSAPMVRALLDGTKWQTRRVVKGMALEWLNGASFTPDYVASAGNSLCPYGYPGDELWVRETWTPGAIIDGRCSGNSFVRFPDGGQKYKDGAYYRPENYAPGEFKPERLKWKPSIHMPRWASRITLEVTNTHVERLQAISHEDAEAEGVKCDLSTRTFRDHFRNLWERINGEDSWTANPWVWVIEFKRVTP